MSSTTLLIFSLLLSGTVAFRGGGGFQKFVGVGDLTNIITNDQQQHGHGSLDEDEAVGENHNYGKFSLGGEVVNSQFGQMPQMPRGKFIGVGKLEGPLIENVPQEHNDNEELQLPHNHNYGKFLGNGQMVNPIFDRRPKQIFESF